MCLTAAFLSMELYFLVYLKTKSETFSVQIDKLILDITETEYTLFFIRIYFENFRDFEKDRYNFVCWNICKYNTIFFCFFNRVKQPLLVNKDFTEVITLNCPWHSWNKIGYFRFHHAISVRIDIVTSWPRWLQRKAVEHMHNVTRYRSRYQTLVIDTPINSKTEMS